MNVTRNSLFGILGFGIPSAVVFLTYPVMLKSVGAEPFGIYALAASLTSILNLLDLGVTSATTRHVAQDLARGRRRSASALIATSLVFYGVLGCCGAAVLWLASDYLSRSFGIAPAHRDSAAAVFRLAALQTVPALLNAVLAAAFKGFGEFKLSSTTLCISSVLTNAGGAALVVATRTGVVGLGAASLAANSVALLWSVRAFLRLGRERGLSLRRARPRYRTARRLFGFGSAMAAHTASAFLLAQGQRILIGIFAGPAAVAVWTLASTIAVRVHSLVVSGTEVLFPLTSSQSDPRNVRHVYLRMLAASAAVAAAILFPIAVFAKPLLSWWITPEMAAQAGPILTLLSAGYFAMALSPVPFYLLNGVGRAWMNVGFDWVNVAVAGTVLLIAASDGISVSSFAWAFSAGNVVTSALYLVFVELAIWRRPAGPVRLGLDTAGS